MILKYKNILYVYSDSRDNRPALKKVISLAQKNQANLTILFTSAHDTLLNTLSFAKDKLDKFIEQQEAEREQLVSEFSDSISIKTIAIQSDSFIDVIKKVQQHNYDLIVKLSESESVLGALFGSNDMGFIRQSPCPIWLMNLEDKDTTHSIIATVDVSTNYPEDERAVREQLNLDVLIAAISLAETKACSLKIVSAWSAPHENLLRHSAFMQQTEEEVNAYVSTLEKQHAENFDTFMALATTTLGKEVIDYIDPECVSIKGNPKDVISVYAKEIHADLVVMGTVARVGIPGLIIGNTAENILSQLNQSVLAIKPKGFTPLIGK